MPYLSFAAICLLFGSNFVLMARAGEAFGPVAIAAWRVAGAAVFLLAAWRLLAPGERVPRRHLGRCAAVGLVANGYPYLVMPWLIAQGFGHSFFAMMVTFTPLLTILVSAPMLGIRPAARQLVGVLSGLVFMGLLMLDGSERGITPSMLLLAFSAPLSYAVANTYLRRHLSDVPAMPLTATMLLAAAALLLPLSACDPLLNGLGVGGPTEPQGATTAVAALVVLGVFGTGATMWLFVRLVQQQGPLFAGMVTYVVPVVALLWRALDGEPITPRQLVAITGVLATVAVVQYGAADSRREEEVRADVAPAASEV